LGILFNERRNFCRFVPAPSEVVTEMVASLLEIADIAALLSAHYLVVNVISGEITVEKPFSAAVPSQPGVPSITTSVVAIAANNVTWASATVGCPFCSIITPASILATLRHGRTLNSLTGTFPH
jgi:hypothetical protein